jgi:predicted nucleotidyltransferase component of viral defense system
MLDLEQIESFYPEYLHAFKRNLLREYLQYKILEAIFSSGYAGKLAFMGGTAIHMLYGNARFSEDLDFDNLGLGKNDFKKLTGIISKRLMLEGYVVQVSSFFKRAWRSYLKIEGLLYKYGISRHKEEKVIIQLDTEPQNFRYRPDKVMLNKFDVFVRINGVPLDVLLSQKIYSIFMRKRPLGRDFYDAIFLFGKTSPNFSYLGLKLKIDNASLLKERLLERCARIDFKQLAEDVRQYLFVPQDADKIRLFTAYVKDLKI